MPYEIRFEGPPLGYAMGSTSGADQPAKVTVREFTSSEDGQLFIARLEGWPTTILSMLPPEARAEPSTLDHLVVVIRRDLVATVYLNELAYAFEAVSTRAIAAGESVFDEDLADIRRLSFTGVEVPPEAAVLIVFSAGWRKALYFDFEPLRGEARSYDLWKLLGSFWGYLKNQNLFALSNEEWDYLIDNLWFPFLSLPRSIMKSMLSRARGRNDLDVIVPEVRAFVDRDLPKLLERWAEKEILASHLEFFRHAARRFQEEDYISCTAILYPRIEGVLRDLHIYLGTADRATQPVLTNTLVDNGKVDFHAYSWLVPERFREYLMRGYFAAFEPGKPAKLSRNSVGHGVLDIGAFNEKAASIGFLVIDQIFWYLPRREAPVPGPAGCP